MTQEQAIYLTRLHFSRLDLRIAKEARAGKYPIHNDPMLMYAEYRLKAAASLHGANDHTFTFKQYMHWLMTGVCVPLLP